MSQHKEPSNSVFAIGGNLALIALGAGVILATINYFTSPIRTQNEIRLKNEAKQMILPEANEFKEMVDHAGWFEGFNTSGTKVGYILPIHQKGFDGFIDMLVGVTLDYKIVDYKILKDKETPGLGAKAKEQFFRERFFGKGADEMVVSKVPEQGKILAITGSTITSKAITNGIKRALVELETAQKK